jgi:hypothetical protein
MTGLRLWLPPAADVTHCEPLLWHPIVGLLSSERTILPDQEA